MKTKKLLLHEDSVNEYKNNNSTNVLLQIFIANIT